MAVEQARPSTSAVELADQQVTDGKVARGKSTGGRFGRLPKKLVTSPDISPVTTFLLAYRSLHVDGMNGWGCNHKKVSETVRGGCSLGVFKRAVREAKAGGHLQREQGKRKRNGRGRGYAIDRLTFDRPDTDYVRVDRDLFDGTLTPTEITALLYLRARGDRLATPWQLMRRLGATRPTVSALMRGRSQTAKREATIGLVERGGRAQLRHSDCALLGARDPKKSDPQDGDPQADDPQANDPHT
jgi:hypothetical protein